ncbi:MAG: DNA helicase RecQ [Clostridiales Family XIII bacterium]|jgi:ATP-dependent DNA helicase RecQ|nr:DNA helicase RecQ [Clostridiales Family XIII bacterium]
MTPEGALSRFFGYENFREGQAEVIRQILGGRDALAVMPTGAGKSLCYQIPALLMDGVTLVISPLISLMKDQVAALRESGVAAAMINSSLGYGEYSDVLRGMESGDYKIVYVAPERLSNEEFLAAAGAVNIAMVAVDEAHCVSQWGQNFRPSYLQIDAFCEGLSVRPILAAFTATATGRVREDIIEKLSLREPFETVTGFNRENLYFSVIRPKSKMKELSSFIASRSGSSGIVYCSTRKTVEDVCEKLCAEGVSASRYHAGLGDAERKRNQEDFQYDRKSVMVATNAFGMGIDKSNVSFVVHYNMPKDVESYYQEAGRAGRDGEPADCVLYYSGQDVRLNRFLIEKSVHENDELSQEQRKEIMESDLEKLKLMTFYSTTTDCLRSYILKYFGERCPSFCGYCSNCDTQFEEVEVTREARAVFSCVFILGERGLSFGKSFLAQVLRGEKKERVLSYRLDRIKTFGYLSGVPAHRIGQIVDHLLNEGFLSVSDGQYPVVSLEEGATEKFRAIVEGGGRFVMKLPKEKDKKTKAKEKEKKSSASFAGAHYDEELFEALRSLRRRLADEAGVAAFVVFSDATLRDMCRHKPTSLEAFMEVSGVGKTKCERYGDAFISEIRIFEEAK